MKLNEAIKSKQKLHEAFNAKELPIFLRWLGGQEPVKKNAFELIK